MTETAVVTKTDIANHIQEASGSGALACADLLAQAEYAGAGPEAINTIAMLANDSSCVRLPDLWLRLEAVSVWSACGLPGGR